MGQSEGKSNIAVTEVFAVLLFLSLKGLKMIERDN